MKKNILDIPREEDLLTLIMNTSTTVWENDLVERDVLNWLNNFRGEVLSNEEERLLALWFLSHFTYYNKNEITHLCKILHSDLIHKILKVNYNENIPFKETVNNFFSKTSIISPGKTSDSGGFIAYFFRHENNLPVRLFNFSHININDSIENLLVIDDVTLSKGEKGQAFRFFRKIVKTYPKKNFFLLTLIANEECINYLKAILNVEVICAIKLDKRDKAFNKESDVFNDYPDLILPAKKFATHYGKKIFPDMPLGYHNGQYSFGFFYNTPNNSLPIFWGSVKGWIPIFKRYHKNFKFDIKLKDERFI